MPKNNEYTTGNLLDYLHDQNYYLIGRDLSRQANVNVPQHINFKVKLEEDDEATMFFIPKSSKKLF